MLRGAALAARRRDGDEARDAAGRLAERAPRRVARVHVAELDDAARREQHVVQARRARHVVLRRRREAPSEREGPGVQAHGRRHAPVVAQIAERPRRLRTERPERSPAF